MNDITPSAGRGWLAHRLKLTPISLVAGAMLIGSCALFASCSSSNSDKTTPTAAATTAVASASAATGSSTAAASSTSGSATSTATKAPASTATPNAAAQKLVETAGYFLYTARTGDTST
ncbi:MAG: hypothetical protein ABI305_10155, partial [Tepidiformaceae bacterium]